MGPSVFGLLATCQKDSLARPPSDGRLRRQNLPTAREETVKALQLAEIATWFSHFYRVAAGWRWQLRGAEDLLRELRTIASGPCVLWTYQSQSDLFTLLRGRLILQCGILTTFAEGDTL